MLFLIKAENVPDGAALRKSTIPAHVAYLNQYKSRFICGGPMLSDDGNDVIGSVMVLDMPSREALDSFLAKEPYNMAGLFRKIEIARWRFGTADVNPKDFVVT